MPDDLRPAPRLPLDTADYITTRVAGMDGFINFEPGEPVYQVSLLNTQTPEYYAPAHDRQLYGMMVTDIHPDERSALIAVQPILVEFANTTPRPPQWPWEYRE